MKISTVIIGIALFAIVTMILYGWGIVKQKNQTSDLMNLLFSKGQDKIKKYLKQHEYVTISQVEQICEGLEAKQPFSRNKAVVKDKKNKPAPSKEKASFLGSAGRNMTYREIL